MAHCIPLILIQMARNQLWPCVSEPHDQLARFLITIYCGLRATGAQAADKAGTSLG